MSYLSAWDVPLALSASCRPGRVKSILNYHPVPENLADQLSYDFAFEKSVIALAEADAAEAKAWEDRAKELENSRRERKLAETRAKAPGFSGDNAILQPTSSTTSSLSAALISSSTVGSSAAGASGLDLAALSLGEKTTQEASNQPINLQEFESSLAPPDPWDAQSKDSDLRALSEVMASTTISVSHAQQQSHTASQISSQQSQPFGVPPQQPREQPSNYGASPDIPTLSQPVPLPLSSSLLQSFQFNQVPLIPPQIPPPPPAVKPQSPPPPTSYILRDTSSMVGSAGLTSNYETGGVVAYPSLNAPTLESSALFEHHTQSPSGLNQAAAAPAEPNVPEDPPGFAAFRERYSSMGFSSIGISHAIRRFRGVESKYLDYLFAHDKFMGEGFGSWDVDLALESMADESEVGVRRFLNDMKTLTEMGFPREKAADALVLHNRDVDAALASLIS